MKITSLTLGGFKGIKNTATIPLAPITLLFGANSTGKSTVLQGLLYLYEVIAHRNFDAEFSSIAGENMYFGGFCQLVHGKSKDNKITLGATLDFSDDNVPWNDYLSDIESEIIEEHIGVIPESFSDIWSFELDISWDVFTDKPFVSRYQCSSPDMGCIYFDKKAGKQEVYIWDSITKLDWLQDGILNLDEETHDVRVPIKQLDALPDINKRLDLSDAPPHFIYIPESSTSISKTFIESTLSQITLAPLKLFIRKLETLFHIGPLRVIPNRNFVANEKITSKNWFDGTAGWDAFTYGSDTLKENVNRYFSLKSGLATPYVFQSTSEDNVLPGKRTVYLENQETGSHHYLNEVGVGVSQLFPFVVASCQADSAIVSCEQPELHIHPRWQLALADMMLESHKENPDKMFLVETHSEHLMLRLLKRRRQTAEDEMDELSNAFCKQDDIQIIFCEQKDGETKLLPIATTDEGEFDAPWPNGFYSERREELF